MARMLLAAGAGALTAATVLAVACSTSKTDDGDATGNDADGGAGRVGSTSSDGGEGADAQDGSPAPRATVYLSLLSGLPGPLYSEVDIVLPTGDAGTGCVTTMTIGDCVRVDTCPPPVSTGDAASGTPVATIGTVTWSGMGAYTDVDGGYFTLVDTSAAADAGGQFLEPPQASFGGGEPVRVTTSGGTFPAYTADLQAPLALLVSAPVAIDGGAELSRKVLSLAHDADTVFTWTRGAAGVEFYLQLDAVTADLGQSSVICRAPSEKGTTTFPQALLAGLSYVRALGATLAVRDDTKDGFAFVDQVALELATPGKDIATVVY